MTAAAPKAKVTVMASIGKIGKTGVIMRRYQFVPGVSLGALEEEVNRLVNEEPSLKLIQVLQVMGSGLVAVMERPDGLAEPRLVTNEVAPEKKGTGNSGGPKKAGGTKTPGGKL
jgi:hypothetical protein